MAELRIGCLVMAAGSGSRFGRNKLEAVVDGKSLLRRSLEAVPTEEFAQVTVVTQYDAAAALAEEFGFTVVRNDRPEDGLSRTVRLGTEAMAGCGAILYQVADQPLLEQETVRREIEYFRTHPDHIVGLAHNGVRGNPCIFPRRFFPELMALEGDVGGNVVIRAHPDALLLYETSAAELRDVDTVEALFTSGIISMVADACRDHGVPIRVGVNSGSVEKGLLEKYGLCAKSLCESALGHVKLLEDCGFEDICISVKASDVAMTVEANRLLSTLCDYPLHIGVTEAGTKERGILKSAAGIGALLLDGIGDTIRISLTDAPEEEAHAGGELLRALGLRSGVQFVSCPSCGRTEYDLIGTAKTVEARLRDKPWNITVAVMGCVVNGPGEASDADIGIAGGDGCGILFVKGRQLKKLPYDELLPALLAYIGTL